MDQRARDHTLHLHLGEKVVAVDRVLLRNQGEVTEVYLVLSSRHTVEERMVDLEADQEITMIEVAVLEARVDQERRAGAVVNLYPSNNRISLEPHFPRQSLPRGNQIREDLKRVDHPANLSKEEKSMPLLPKRLYLQMY